MGRVTTASGVLVLLLGVGTVAIALIVAFALLEDAVPILSMLGIVVVYYGVVFAALLTRQILVRRTAKVRVKAAYATALSTLPNLKLVDTVPVSSIPLVIGALRATGTCPWGFRPGDTWYIDRGGHLRPQLCRAAVESLCPLLQGSRGTVPTQSASCRCPLGYRKIEFAIIERR